MAAAVPSGVVTAEALAKLTEIMLEELSRSGSLDGLLVAPHGAAVCETVPDMDGHWLTRLREAVGPNLPIICTLDLHANVSQRMVDACNAILAYRTNPHLDQRDRGIEAAQLMARTLRGEVRPTVAAAFPRLAINIERQLTRDDPCRSLFARADEIRHRPGVLGASVVLGFPYADVAEMGSSFIVVTDNDPQFAKTQASELADYAWTHRQDFVGELISIDDALTRAIQSPKPVCLLDMGDNVGGGSAADGTFLAHALIQQSIRGFVALFDPASAKQATDAGPGSRIRLQMGGKTDALHGSPIVADVVVQSIHDGKFAEMKVRHGGRAAYDMGPTAIVTTDSGLTIQLTSKRMVPFSLGQLTSCGIDPKQFDVIVAKGVHAPVAAYEEVCPTMIRANTPGVTTADMTRLPFHQRRRPLFPFEAM
jgi:microcystin degradation protein MlrC